MASFTSVTQVTNCAKFNFAAFVTARVPVESRCFGNPMRSARFGSAQVDNGLHTLHVGSCGRIER
jgi:hypothetical protein